MQTVQKTVVPTGAVLGQYLRLALVVSASVRHPSLTRSTPSTSCVCLLSVAGYEYGFSDLLEREVQRDVRVHSSSCGAHRDVVHSPFEWLYHRCHYNCRGFVLFVGRLPCCGGVCVAMSCCGGFFTPDGAYDSVWDRVKPMTGNVSSIISSTKISLGVYAC